MLHRSILVQLIIDAKHLTLGPWGWVWDGSFPTVSMEDDFPRSGRRRFSWFFLQNRGDAEPSHPASSPHLGSASSGLSYLCFPKGMEMLEDWNGLVLSQKTGVSGLEHRSCRKDDP